MKRIKKMRNRRHIKPYTHLGCPMTRSQSVKCLRFCQPDVDLATAARLLAECKREEAVYCSSCYDVTYRGGGDLELDVLGLRAQHAVQLDQRLGVEALADHPARQLGARLAR